VIYSPDFTRTRNSLVDLNENVALSIRNLQPHVAEFDVIAVTGISGLVVGAPVAVALKKPLVVVRKDGERSHAMAEHNFETYGPVVGGHMMLAQRVLWLDDFEASGKTRRRVEDAIKGYGGEFVASYLYQGDAYDQPTLDWRGEEPISASGWEIEMLGMTDEPPVQGLRLMNLTEDGALPGPWR